MMSDAQGSSRLTWCQQGVTLVLQGELDRQSVQLFWQQRQEIMLGVETLQVSGLQRVDSAGAALLIQLIHEAGKNGVSVVLTGLTENLKTLFTLYNLSQFIPGSQQQ